jgi:hypothetical protein
MIIKEIKKELDCGTEYKGKGYFIEYQYIDGGISKNICRSINDYYNLMHLIKNSWTNKKYILRQRDAGYDIYSQSNKYLGAWIGVPEKSSNLYFFIYDYDINNHTFIKSGLWEKAEKVNQKWPMVVYDLNDGIWVYNEILLSTIFKRDNEEDQRKILTEWINETTKKIL